jgi:Tfp pilus assembly protein FimV
VPAAVYRRRRLLTLLVLAAALVALIAVGARVVGGAGAEPVRTAPGAAPVVHDPAAFGASGSQPPPGAVYIVQPGDTLWSIAVALAPGSDTRDEVDRLAALNGGAALEVGQRLRLTQG